MYTVADIAAFRHYLERIRRFGELMILQLPDEMESPPPADGRFTYLMQFFIELGKIREGRLR